MSPAPLAPPAAPERPWRRLRGSLRLRFVVAISALVAVVLLSLAGVLAATSHRALRQDIERRAESHAALAAGLICDAYETHHRSDSDRFRELVEGIIGHNPDLRRVALYDPSGRLLFGSEELSEARAATAARARAPAADPRLPVALRGLERASWRSQAPGEPVFYRVVVPRVEERGEHRYSVVFDASYEGLDAAVRQTGARLLWLTIGLLALGVLFAMVLARQSLEPLEALIGGARELAGGDLDRRIALRTGDEFEVLGNAFIDMAARLAASISELEASNRALQQSNLELRELDRVKSDLLANVSHELRTPLTSLKGYTEAMAERLLGPITEAQREALEVSERNLGRLLAMIDELLSFAALESGPVMLEPTDTDLVAMAEHAIAGLPAGSDRAVEVRLEAEPGLPLVRADAQRLSQVFDNLLTNAVKFTPAGGRVELRLRREGARVCVEVADTGIGIPGDRLERIFERFYQVESSSTRKYGGIGLGLAIVRQILDAHECAIEVESALGQGTTFRFRLPAAEGAQLVGSTEGPRVAVIDEDATFAGELARHLDQRGMTARVAASLHAAERLVRELEPVAVVLDRLLPDGDGFDLLARWRRQRRARLVVVVISVRPEEALARRLGADAYLLKPVPPQVVWQTLASLLSAAGVAVGPAGGGRPGR